MEMEDIKEEIDINKENPFKEKYKDYSDVIVLYEDLPCVVLKQEIGIKYSVLINNQVVDLIRLNENEFVEPFEVWEYGENYEYEDYEWWDDISENYWKTSWFNGTYFPSYYETDWFELQDEIENNERRKNWRKKSKRNLNRRKGSSDKKTS